MYCDVVPFPYRTQCLYVSGRELSLAQQYAAVGALSFPLLWVAGAGSAVFWVIGQYLLHHYSRTYYINHVYLGQRSTVVIIIV